MNDMPKNKQTVLITGASSGIGLELSHIFAENGYNLVLTARREQELKVLAHELTGKYSAAVDVLVADLSEASAPQAIVDALQSKKLDIDILANNAGFGAFGAVVGIDLKRQMDMIQVNVTALTVLTRLLLPAIIARGNGGILNIASTAAFQCGPYMAVYYATKAYVLSFTEALAEELKDTNIQVSCLAPGPTRTPFFVRAQKERIYNAKSALANAKDALGMELLVTPLLCLWQHRLARRLNS